MNNIIKKIQNNIFQNNLFEKKSKLVLGVSGGPDSIFLLDIFYKLKKKYRLDLIIAHVNYGLRKKDSDKDQALVEKMAKKYSLKMLVLKPKIEFKSDLENKLRKIRYDFFEKTRLAEGFDMIAVAHTIDDQAETYIMHLLRGAGLQGLSSMKFKSGKIIRPILSISKKEILEYLEKNKIEFRIDQTNLKNVFLRNKIRNILIPIIEKGFNPGIIKTLFNSSLSITEDFSFLEEICEKEYRKSGKSIKKILALHPAIQKRIILKLIAEKKSDLKDIESSHVTEIMKIMRSKKGKNQIALFNGLKLTRKGDNLNIEILNK